MERGGFLETRKLNPVGLGLIVAAHGAVLTALALAPPEAITRIIFVPTIVDSIKDTTPPQPLPPAPKVKQNQKIDTPQPVVPPIGDTAISKVDIDTRPVTTTGTTDPVAPAKLPPVLVQAVMDPAAAGRFQPEYPAALARAEIEGVATVRVLIATDGHIKQVDLVSATDPAFFEATRKQALRYWRFRPATSDGTPAESWRTMTVRFRLQG